MPCKIVNTVEDVDASKKLKTLANITSLFNFQREGTDLECVKHMPLEMVKRYDLYNIDRVSL